MERTGVVWTVLRAELAGSASLAVLDLGGGSGVSAVPLAELGHHVTVVDASADALATLQRRAADAGVAGLVTPVQGDVERLPATVEGAAYDLVLCHSLLEVVDEPAATLATRGRCAAARRLRERAGCRPGRRGAGPRARRPPGRRAAGADRPDRPVGARRRRAASLRHRRAGRPGRRGGLRVEAVHGVRVVTDLVPGAVLDAEPGVAEALRELEAAAAGLSPYRDLAAQLHVLARR